MLGNALESLCRMKSPGTSGWEVIVVDNGSSDATSDTVASFGDRLPIRRVFAGVIGLAAARNAAIEAANGSYIIWTDDDVLVDCNWLRSYEAAFARHPRAAFFGGPIRPYLLAPAPDWIRQSWTKISGVFAGRDLGNDEVPLKPDRYRLPFGANYAIKLGLQRQYPYNAELGRKGRRLIGGEELDVMLSLLESGESGYWIPSALVHHVVPPHRLTRGYVRKYYRGLGATHVIRRALANDRIGGPRSLVRLGWQIVRLEGRYLLDRSFGSSENWLPIMTEASKMEGRFVEQLWRMLRSGRTQGLSMTQTRSTKL